MLQVMLMVLAQAPWYQSLVPPPTQSAQHSPPLPFPNAGSGVLYLISIATIIQTAPIIPIAPAGLQ